MVCNSVRISFFLCSRPKQEGSVAFPPRRPRPLGIALAAFLCGLFLFVSPAASQPPSRPAPSEASRPHSSPAAASDPQTGLQDIFVCTGDSITVGYPYCPGMTAVGCDCPGCYVPRLAVLSGIPTVNEGVSGAQSDYGADMIDTYLTQNKPQTLTIYYGNNDPPSLTAEETLAHLRWMVDRCLAYGTRPIIATLGPQFGYWAYRQPYILDINQGIRQLAAARGIPCADIAVALWDKPSYFLDDGIHPNLAGHAVIADAFFRAINRCAYGIAPLSVLYRHVGGTGSVSVTTGAACAWAAASHAAWITVTGGGSGVGSGTVAYRVAFNDTGRERTGALTVAGKTFTVTQKKAPGLDFLHLLLGE